MSTSMRDFAVSVTPYLGVVSRFSGGRPTAGSTPVYNGGAKTPTIIPGRLTYEDVTVALPYRPRQHAPVIGAMHSTIRTKVYTITVQDKDENGFYIGRPRVFTGCRLKALNFPGYDENTDAEPAYLECVFAVSHLVA